MHFQGQGMCKQLLGSSFDVLSRDLIYCIHSIFYQRFDINSSILTWHSRKFLDVFWAQIIWIAHKPFFLHCEAFFLIFCGGIDFISTEFIALAAYLWSQALVAPIIVIRFFLYNHPFLLEVISASNFGLLPFQAHLKLV